MNNQELEQLKDRMDQFFQNRPVRPDVVLDFVATEIENDRKKRA